MGNDFTPLTFEKINEILSDRDNYCPMTYYNNGGNYKLPDLNDFVIVGGNAEFLRLWKIELIIKEVFDNQGWYKAYHASYFEEVEALKEYFFMEMRLKYKNYTGCKKEIERVMLTGEVTEFDSPETIALYHPVADSDDF